MKKLLATLGLLLTYGCSTPVIADDKLFANDHDIAWYLKRSYHIVKGGTATIGDQNEYVQSVLLEDNKGDLSTCMIDPQVSAFERDISYVTVSCVDLYITKDTAPSK